MQYEILKMRLSYLFRAQSRAMHEHPDDPVEQKVFMLLELVSSLLRVDGKTLTHEEIDDLPASDLHQISEVIGNQNERLFPNQ